MKQEENEKARIKDQHEKVCAYISYESQRGGFESVHYMNINDDLVCDLRTAGYDVKIKRGWFDDGLAPRVTISWK